MTIPSSPPPSVVTTYPREPSTVQLFAIALLALTYIVVLITASRPPPIRRRAITHRTGSSLNDLLPFTPSCSIIVHHSIGARQVFEIKAPSSHFFMKGIDATTMVVSGNRRTADNYAFARASSEVFAYQLSEALTFHIVPPTYTLYRINEMENQELSPCFLRNFNFLQVDSANPRPVTIQQAAYPDTLPFTVENVHKSILLDMLTGRYQKRRILLPCHARVIKRLFSRKRHVLPVKLPFAPLKNRAHQLLILIINEILKRYKRGHQCKTRRNFPPFFR